MRSLSALAASGALLATLACLSPETSESSRDRSARAYSDCMDRGNQHFLRAEYDKASREFRYAAQYMPESAAAHNMLGMALMRQKYTAQAMESFRQAVALDKAYAAAYCNIGALHASEQRFDLAKDALKKAIACQPDLAAAHYSLGTLLVMLGEAEEGRSFLLKSFELNPDYMNSMPQSSISLAGKQTRGVDVNLAFARIYASSGFSEELLHYLEAAKKLGFTEWKVLLDEKAFEKVREHPRVLAVAK